MSEEEIRVLLGPGKNDPRHKPWAVVARLIRSVEGWDQDEMASIMGVDRLTVGRWERGESEPSPDNQIGLHRLEVHAKRKINDAYRGIGEGFGDV